MYLLQDNLHDQNNYLKAHEVFQELLRDRLGEDLSSGQFVIISEEKNYVNGITGSDLCDIGLRANEAFDRFYRLGMVKKEIFIILTSKIGELDYNSHWSNELKNNCPGVMFSKVSRCEGILFVEDLFTTDGYSVCPQLVLIIPTEFIFNEPLKLLGEGTPQPPPA